MDAQPMQVNSHTAAKGMTQVGNHTPEYIVLIVPAKSRRKRTKSAISFLMRCIGSAAHQDRMQAIHQKYMSAYF